MVMKSFNLPDDVFDPGEEKPQKKSAKNTANKKRGPPEVILSHRLFAPRCGMRYVYPNLLRRESAY